MKEYTEKNRKRDRLIANIGIILGFGILLLSMDFRGISCFFAGILMAISRTSSSKYYDYNKYRNDLMSKLFGDKNE